MTALIRIRGELEELLLCWSKNWENHYSGLSAGFMAMNSICDTYCRDLMEQQQRTSWRYMHQRGSVSRVSPREKMAQDICSVPSSVPVISQLSTNVWSILSYSGMPILLIRKTYFFPWLRTIVSIYANWQYIRHILKGTFIKSNISCATVQSINTQVRRTWGIRLDRLAKLTHNRTTTDDWHFGGSAEAICD